MNRAGIVALAAVAAAGCAEIETVTHDHEDQEVMTRLRTSLWDVESSSEPLDDFAAWTPEMPFRTIRYDVTEAQVAAAFDTHDDLMHWDKVGVHSSKWGPHHGTRCHTQGISVLDGTVVTSCMTHNTNADKREGFLQYYRLGGKSLGSFADGARSAASDMVDVYGQPTPHAAVGQGATGVSVLDYDGTMDTEFDKRFVVPVVSEKSGGDNVPAVVDLRDQNGVVRYTFEHQPHSSDPQKGLAAVSLLEMPLDGEPTLYLVAISKTYVYVYVLHFGKTRGGKWFWGHQRWFAAKATDMVQGGTGWPPASDFQTAYQSIVWFRGKGHQLYMLAGHDEWLDTYKVITPTSAALNDDPSLLPIMLDKIAVQKIQFSGDGKGIFYEGMSLAKVGERGVRLWLAPKDYKNTKCSTGTSADTKCTQIWRLDTEFSAPTPTAPDCYGTEGCRCLDVVVGYPSGEDTIPDGDYSSDQYCPNDGDVDVVCSKTTFNASQTVGICKRCDTFPLPSGCPCRNSDECGYGDSCYGADTLGGGSTGLCLDSTQPPKWTCLADCERLFNSSAAWCYVDHDTGGRCFDVSCSAPFDTNECATEDQVCVGGECVVECESNADCGALGYPAAFECIGNICRHPAQVGL